MKKINIQKGGRRPLLGVYSFWNDGHFQDQLTYLLIHDQETLERCLSVGLDSGDLVRLEGESTARWIVACHALEYFRRHSQPLGNLARLDLLYEAAWLGLAAANTNDIEQYLDNLDTLKPVSRSSIIARVIEFKNSQRPQARQEEI